MLQKQTHLNTEAKYSLAGSAVVFQNYQWAIHFLNISILYALLLLPLAKKWTLQMISTACSLLSSLDGRVSASKLLGNLLLCTRFMNSFTSESEMIRELNMGTDCSASVQPDLLLMLGLNSRKLVSKLASLFQGSFQNLKLLKQQEPPSLFSRTFTMTEGKGKPHEQIPVQIK